MISVELKSGEIVECQSISSDPMSEENFLLQIGAYVQEIKWNEIKHIK